MLGNGTVPPKSFGPTLLETQRQTDESGMYYFMGNDGCINSVSPIHNNFYCEIVKKFTHFNRGFVRQNSLLSFSILLYTPLFSRTVIFAVLARCGNSRVVNFAILLMLSLL